VLLAVRRLLCDLSATHFINAYDDDAPGQQGSAQVRVAPHRVHLWETC
jgi:hypothetical protein